VRRHLQVLGAPVVVALDVKGDGTKVPLTALLPHARRASDTLEVHVRGRAALAGLTRSCAPKCTACCSQLVPVASLEALGIAQAVAAMPEPSRTRTRRRFADAVARLERAGLLNAKDPKGRTAMQVQERPGESTWDALNRRYRDLRLPCPLLGPDALCTVYESRPAACREYAVSSPKEICSDPRGAPAVLPRPVRLGEALAQTGAALMDDDTRFVPLPLAIEWAEEASPRWEAQVFDEAEAVRALLDALETSET
jgi:Fe-S-cluster containining protein